MINSRWNFDNIASKRSLSDLTLMPIAKVNVLSVQFDTETHLLQIHTLIPRQHAEPESPLDLCVFCTSVDETKVGETQTFCQLVMGHIYEG